MHGGVTSRIDLRGVDQHRPRALTVEYQIDELVVSRLRMHPPERTSIDVDGLGLDVMTVHGGRNAALAAKAFLPLPKKASRTGIQQFSIRHVAPLIHPPALPARIPFNPLPA